MGVPTATADTREVFDQVLDVYVPVGGAVFVLVLLVLAFVLVRDRARGDRQPSRVIADNRVEIPFIVLLAVVAGLLAWRTVDAVRADAPVADRAVAVPGAGPAGLTIKAIAAKWNWRFEYPGGVAQIGDGAARPAMLVVPSGGPVRFRLVAADVEHAFWIPAARYKYDAVPGRTNVFDMQFDADRSYTGARCSEFCGQYHEQMRFRVRVMRPDAFRDWLRQRQQRAVTG